MQIVHFSGKTQGKCLFALFCGELSLQLTSDLKSKHNVPFCCVHMSFLPTPSHPPLPLFHLPFSTRKWSWVWNSECVCVCVSPPFSYKTTVANWEWTRSGPPLLRYPPPPPPPLPPRWDLLPARPPAQLWTSSAAAAVAAVGPLPGKRETMMMMMITLC